MTIDPAAVLALLSTLMQQVVTLQAENAELRRMLSEAGADSSSPPNEAG